MSTQGRIIDQHIELRELAAEALYRTAMVAENMGSTIHQDDRDVLRSQLLREAAERLLDDQFTLSVVGEFSRGKSTLINALLGQEELLPTSIEPTTAAITVLTQGEKAEATVTYDDGSVAEGVPLSDLPEYVLGDDLDGQKLQTKVTQRVARFTRARKAESVTADEVQEEVRKELGEAPPKREVSRVDVTYPSEFLADGIRIVDTPGLGSINPKHGEATRGFVGESDAVLFLINTDPVISASECNFLTFLQDFVDQFLFVVTKIDRYTQEERETSLHYTRETITQFANIGEPSLYPVSARLALEGQVEGDTHKFGQSGFVEFLRALDEFLVDGRGQRILREYVGTARMHALDMRKGIELELAGIELGLDDLRDRIANARKHLQRAQLTRANILEVLDNQVDHMVEDIVLGPTHTARLRLTSALREDLHAQLDQCGWDELQQAAQVIPIYVQEMMGERLQNVLRHITDHLSLLREDVARDCLAVLKQLDESLGLEVDAGGASREDFAPQLEPDRFRADLQRATTATIGSTLTVALQDGFRLRGIGSLVLLGGGLLARTGVAAGLHNQARQQVKDIIEEPLRELVGQILANVKDEALRQLREYCTSLGDMLGRAIDALGESVTRQEEQRASTEFSTADRRDELRTELANLDEIESVLRRARASSA